MAKISIVTRPSKNGTSTLPLFLRISHKGSTRYVSLGTNLRERDWNATRQEVRRSHPDHVQLNQYFSSTQAKAQTALASLLASGEAVTAARLKEHVETKLRPHDAEEERKEDFFAFTRRLLVGYAARGQVGTHKQYRSVVKKLREYHAGRYGNERLDFDDLTVRYLREYQTYLVEELENGPNTVHKNLANLRTMIRFAIKEGLMAQEDYPFFYITLKKKKVRKKKLTVKDVDKIATLDLETGSLLWEVRNWFLFAFYAGGVRFGDVATLRRRNLQDGHVKYDMIKTDEYAGVPLVPQAAEILALYDDRPQHPDALVFPILEGYDLTTAKSQHQAISSRNALTNRYLKMIQRQAGIQTNLTFHLARHSLAAYLYSKGWNIYSIKEILRHSDVKVTEEYLRGFDFGELDDAYRAAF